MEYIKIASFNDNIYGMITEFVTDDDRIVFAYTRTYNNKYTYMLVDDIINKILIEKYLSYNG